MAVGLVVSKPTSKLAQTNLGLVLGLQYPSLPLRSNDENLSDYFCFSMDCNILSGGAIEAGLPVLLETKPNSTRTLGPLLYRLSYRAENLEATWDRIQFNSLPNHGP